jgi:hypothetical protein
MSLPRPVPSAQWAEVMSRVAAAARGFSAAAAQLVQAVGSLTAVVVSHMADPRTADAGESKYAIYRRWRRLDTPAAEAWGQAKARLVPSLLAEMAAE